MAIDLPPELRNRITRFQIEAETHAGAVVLADDRVRRRKVALVGDPLAEGQQLLAQTHYLREARPRVVVELGKGQTLSVRLQNLERAEEPSAVAPTPAAPEGVQRTLQRDNAVLQEFDGTGDPDTLVLYHHLRDRAFDAFNAAEYNEQMLRYYAGGISVSEVVPRKMGDHHYLLICLRNKVRPPKHSIM